MKKILLLLLSIFLSLSMSVQAQVAQVTKEVIGPVSVKVIKKMIPEFIEGEQYVLTEAMINTLSREYPDYQKQLHSGNSISIKEGTLYSHNKILDRIAKSQPENKLTESIKYDPAALASGYAYGKKIRGNTIIFLIQNQLKQLGYEIDDDGKWGNDTKRAIDQALAIDCDDIDKAKLAKLLAVKIQQRNAQNKVVYSISIIPKDGPPVNYTRNPGEMNDLLAHYTCGLDEVCAKFKDDLGGSATYLCKDGKGNEVTITISTKEVSLGVKLKLPDGSSSELSLSSEGKIQLKNSDGNTFRAAKFSTGKD